MCMMFVCPGLTEMLRVKGKTFDKESTHKTFNFLCSVCNDLRFRVTLKLVGKATHLH